MSLNYDLKEKIRDYWSQRAETFDQSFSHRIEEGIELEAWKHFYASLLGADHLNVLELGSGTGEVTKVLRELGHSITGIDFSETMLERAKAKHAAYKNRVTYFLGDAENIHQPDETFDAVTCRHLMWTLLDPENTLRDWFRVTRLGGHLVIFDGNFVSTSPKDQLLRKLISLLERVDVPGERHTAELKLANNEIRSQLYFSGGLSFETLAKLVSAAGYICVTKHSYEPIRRAQRQIAGPCDWLRTFVGDRFVLHAQKSPSTTEI